MLNAYRCYNYNLATTTARNVILEIQQDMQQQSLQISSFSEDLFFIGDITEPTTRLRY